jgi:hypothetical protein
MLYNFGIHSFWSFVWKFLANVSQTGLNEIEMATSCPRRAPALRSAAPARAATWRLFALSIRVPSCRSHVPRSLHHPWPHAARARAWEPALPPRVVHAACPRRPLPRHPFSQGPNCFDSNLSRVQFVNRGPIRNRKETSRDLHSKPNLK